MKVGEQAEKDASFRWVLLQRCQQEFTKDNGELEKRKQDVEAAPEAVKKKLELELNLAIAKAKRRSVGNIRYMKKMKCILNQVIPIHHIVLIAVSGDLAFCSLFNCKFLVFFEKV